MDDNRIEFFSLDPKRDPARFERLVQAVVAGARRPAPAAHWLALELVHRGRAAVVAAAVLAAISWLPDMTRGRSPAGGSAVVAAVDPVELVSTWADAGRVPSDIDPAQALGALHDR